MGRTIVKGIAASALVLTLAGTSAAQTHWLHPGEGNNVTLQAFKPKFSGEMGLSTLTSVLFLSSETKIGETIDLVVDVPLVNVDYDESFPYAGDNETLIGNPYIGLEARLNERDAATTTIGRVGVRPPLAPDDKWEASFIGFLTCPYRLEALVPDLWSFTFGGGFGIEQDSGFRLKSNVDAVILVPTRDGADTEIYLNYNLTAWLRASDLKFGAGVGGRWHASGGDPDFGESSLHQLGFAGVVDLGVVQPGLHLRVPLDDDLSDWIDYVYGFSLSFEVN